MFDEVLDAKQRQHGLISETSAQAQPWGQFRGFLARMFVLLTGRTRSEQFQFVGHVGETMQSGHLVLQLVNGRAVRNAGDRAAATTDQKTKTFAGRVEQKMRLPSLKLKLPDDFQFHQEHQRAIDGGIVKLVGQFFAAADALQRRRHGHSGQKRKHALAHRGQSYLRLAEFI